MYDVYDIADQVTNLIPHNQLVTLDSLRPQGFPFKGAPEFSKFELLFQQIIDNAQAIAIFSSNYPASPAIPLGVPLFADGDYKEFRAASFLQLRIMRSQINPNTNGSCVISSKIISDPSSAFVSLNSLFDEIFHGMSIKKTIFRTVTPPNLITVQQLNSAHPYHTTTTPVKLTDQIENFGDKPYARLEDLPKFRSNNEEFVKMRRVAEESTFFVGDAIRINIGGEGLVILICRIWATKTQDLPKVFVDGEVLIKMPQIKATQTHYEANNYALAGVKVTIPLSDPMLVKEVERAPVVLVVANDENQRFYHLPTRLAGDLKIEYEICCEEKTGPFEKVDSQPIVIAPSTITEIPPVVIEENQLFQTVAGDSDGFAIGERIHSPIHVYARIIPVDYSNLSAITTYIRGLKNSLNFVPAEKIFGQLSSNNKYTFNNQFAVFPCFFKYLNQKFIRAVDEPELIPQIAQNLKSSISGQFLMKQNDILDIFPVYKDYLCCFCQKSIPSELVAIDQFQCKLIQDPTKEERIFNEMLTLNATGGCYHCPICYSPYHPECYTNQLNTFEKHMNYLCDFQYGLISINTPCPKCRMEWANAQPHVGLDLEDPTHQFINNQINFISSHTINFNNFEESQFYKLAEKIVRQDAASCINEDSINKTALYATRVVQSIFQNWHISIQFDKCKYFSYQSKFGQTSQNQYIKQLSKLRAYASNRMFYMGFPSEDKFEEIEPNLTFRHLPNYSNEIVANFYVEALYRLYPFTPVLNFAGAPLYSYNIFRQFMEDQNNLYQYLKDTNGFRTRDNPGEPILEKPNLLNNVKIPGKRQKSTSLKTEDSVKKTPKVHVDSKPSSLQNLPNKMIKVPQLTTDLIQRTQKQQVALAGKVSIVGTHSEPIMNMPGIYQTKQLQLLEEQRYQESTHEIFNQCHQEFRSSTQNNMVAFDSKQEQLVALFQDLFDQFQKQTDILHIPQKQGHNFFSQPVIEKLADIQKLGILQFDGIKDTLATVQIVNPAAPTSNRTEQLIVDTLFDAPLNPETLTAVVLEKLKRDKQVVETTETDIIMSTLGNIQSMDLNNVGTILQYLQQLEQSFGQNIQPCEYNSLFKFPKSNLVQKQVCEQKLDELQNKVELLTAQDKDITIQAEQTINQIECYRNAILSLKDKISSLIQTLVQEYSKKTQIERSLSLTNQSLVEVQRVINNQVSLSNENQSQGQDKLYVQRKLKELMEFIVSKFGLK